MIATYMHITSATTTATTDLAYNVINALFIKEKRKTQKKRNNKIKTVEEFM